VKLTPYARSTIRTTAEHHRAKLDEIPNEVTRALAVKFGVSAKTVGRVIRGAGKDRPPAFKIAEPHLVAISEKDGIKPAWLALGGADGLGVSYETFARSYRVGIPKAIRVGIKTNDETKMAAQLVYGRFEVAHRNVSWVFDHGELPVTVVGARGQRFRPWATVPLDESKRLIVAAALSNGQPNSDVCAATVGDAIMGHVRPDGTFVGGQPGRMRWDRGSDWLSVRMTNICLSLGILADPCEPYSGWQKGKVERIIKTIKLEFCPQLPGYARRPPLRGRVIHTSSYADEELLTFEEFQARFAAWIEWYNSERPHSALGGRTPLEAWAADETAIERIEDDEVLRPLFLRRAEHRIVTKNGVHFNKVDYAHAGLIDLVGRPVLVGYRTGDAGWIDVYDAATEKFVCTATPAASMSGAALGALLAARARAYTLVSDVAAAADLGRVRAIRREAEADAAGPVEPAPLPSPAKGGLEGRGVELLVKRRKAASSADEKEVA
jgi:putative transposase